MKILVVGLPGAVPELLLGDDRLINIRRLMDAGCYGPLESVMPPTLTPAWLCLATGQDPGSLGVYGARGRTEHSNGDRSREGVGALGEVAVWDQVQRAGGRAVFVGMEFPTRPPASDSGTLTADPLGIRDPRAVDKNRLRGEVEAASRKQFAVAREMLKNQEWDFFQFVETGLDRVQCGFWKDHDPRPGADNPYREVIRDYYQYIDDAIGSLLELLTAETIVLVASPYGAQRALGGFRINEWLVREGLLVLHGDPEAGRLLDWRDIDWTRTRVWSDCESCAHLYFNVKAREPQGIIAGSEYDRFRDDVQSRLEATTDPEGRMLGTRAFKPEEIYRTVRNAAPDLIVSFGDLAWRPVGDVGHPVIYVPENDTSLDECNPARRGAFVLAAPDCPGSGPIEGASLLDIAPTLLELAGYERPAGMQGRSLLPTGTAVAGLDSVQRDAAEMMVRDRLKGLGYLG